MAEGCGTRWRRDRSNGCTMILVYEVHILCSQSLTRKEMLEGKSGLLGMIHMMWGRGSWIRLCAGRVWDALEKG